MNKLSLVRLGASVVLLCSAAVFPSKADTPSAKPAAGKVQLSCEAPPLKEKPVDLEQFRQDLACFLADMEDVAEKIDKSPVIRGTKGAGANSAEGVRSARRSVPTLTENDLALLNKAMRRIPNWQQMPATLSNIANSPAASGARSVSARSDFGEGACPAGAEGGLTTIYILKAGVAAANAVMEALPQDVLSFEAHAVAAGVLGGLEGGELLAEGLQEVHDACVDDKFQGYVTDRLDEIPGRFTTATNTIVNNSNSNKTEIITNDNTNKTAIITNDNTNRAAIINNDNTNKNAIINNDNTNRTLIINNDNANKTAILNDLAARTERLRVALCEVIRLEIQPMGQRSSNCPTCTDQPGFPYTWPPAKGTKSTSDISTATKNALVPVDYAASNASSTDVKEVAAAQAPVATGMPVSQMTGAVTVETQLLEGRLIPTLYLPNSRGGSLEQVRALVWATIDEHIEMQLVKDAGPARALARQADTLLTAKNYLSAYKTYCKAYQKLVESVK